MTLISMKYRMDGGVDIMFDDFVYVSINYDYRYTDNASRAQLAQSIFEALGGKEAETIEP